MAVNKTFRAGGVDFPDLLFLTMLVLKELGHLGGWSWFEVILLWVALSAVLWIGKEAQYQHAKEKEEKS